MPYKFDPEIESALAPSREMRAKNGPLPAHDIINRRTRFANTLGGLNQMLPLPTDVEQKVYHTKTKDGHELELTWFTKKGTTGTSGAVRAWGSLHWMYGAPV